jgi:hypothetical protein
MLSSHNLINTVLTHLQLDLISLSSGQRLRRSRSGPPLPPPVLRAPKSSALEPTGPRHAPNRQLFPPFQHLPRRCTLRSSFSWTECLPASAILSALCSWNRYLTCRRSILGVLGCHFAEDWRV